MASQFQKPVRLVVSVPSAGTPVQLSASPLFVRSFIMQAHHANVGLVFVGDSSGNALDANAHALNPGDNFAMAGDSLIARNVQFDLSDFWIDTSVNGSKVIITYMQEVLHQ